MNLSGHSGSVSLAASPAWRCLRAGLLCLLWQGAVCAAMPEGVAAWRARQDLPSAQLQAELRQRIAQQTAAREQAWWRLLDAELENEQDRADSALALAAEVEQQAIGLGDRELQFEALSLTSVILSNRGQAETLRPLWQRMQALVEAGAGPDWQPRLDHDRGVLARKQGEFEQALGYFERALAAAQALQDPALIARELNSIGMLHGRTGRFADALHAHDQAIQISRDSGDRAEIARGLRLLGVLYRNLDDEELGSGYLEEALQFIDARNHREAISVNAELAQSLIALAELERAEPYALQAVRLAQQTGHAPNRVTAFTRLAELRLAQGRLDEAAAAATQAFDDYAKVALRDQILLQLTRARVQAAQGELVPALAAAEGCVQRARQLGDRILERSALDFLAELQLRSGDAARAYASRKAWQALDKAMAMDMAARRIAVLEGSAERERDAAARALLERDNRIQALTLNRQRLLGGLMAAGLLALLTLAILLFSRYRESRRRHAEALASRDQLARLHAQLAASALELQRIANADALTGLLNRRALVNCLQSAHAEARGSGSALAVAIIDVDHFKRINDGHGHLAGDAVLRETARRLAVDLPVGAKVGRWGGEEFLLLLPRSDSAQAVEQADAIRQRLAAAEVEFEGARIAVTASFGVAAGAGANLPSINELLAGADQALYAAKAAGRNRVFSAAGAGSPLRAATVGPDRPRE